MHRGHGRTDTVAALFAAVATLLLTATATAQESVVSPLLANQLRYVQFRVVGGRIVASTDFSGRHISSSSQGPDRQERLTARLDRAPTISYQVTTAPWRFTLDVTMGRHLVLSHEPRNDTSIVPLKFSQPAEGELVLELGADVDMTVYRARSLWHLLLAEPDLCGRHLLPLLQPLSGDWQLGATSREIEKILLESLRSGAPVFQPHWTALVERLASPRFSDRQAAQRELEAQGESVLAFLQVLNRRDLDAEQWHRVQMVVRRLSGQSQSDVPERAATWLAGDPLVWYALAARYDDTRQQLAVGQLGRLIGHTPTFDAAAEPDVRRAQVEALYRLIPQRHAGSDTR